MILNQLYDRLQQEEEAMDARERLTQEEILRKIDDNFRQHGVEGRRRKTGRPGLIRDLIKSAIELVFTVVIVTAGIVALHWFADITSF